MKIAPEFKWEYENGFYLTSDLTRIPKLLAHYELYKKILTLPGHVIEFGVYKGVSMVQWLTFREIHESPFSRKVFGFDIFGEFPKQELSLEADKKFVRNFEKDGGHGLPMNEIDVFLRKKNFVNFELIKGNITATLPEFLSAHPEYRFSLVHVDVDVYEPSKVILEMLKDRIVSGGLIILDDYGTVEGETRAIDEFDTTGFSPLSKLPISHIPCFFAKL